MTIWTADQPETPAPRKGDWMQTFLGHQFWSMDPDSQSVHPEDIAHALAMQCRFAGHCLRFYSVAEHSVLMTDWFLDQGDVSAARWALLHDASETYLVDVPRPVKPFLRGYREAEDAVMRAVVNRFNLLPFVMPDKVKDADNRILVDERQQNMADCAELWNLPWEPLGVELQYWTPVEAKAQFMMRLNILFDLDAR